MILSFPVEGEVTEKLTGVIIAMNDLVDFVLSDSKNLLGIGGQ